MDQGFVVLAVVNSSQAREQTEEKRDARAANSARGSRWGRNSGRCRRSSVRRGSGCCARNTNNCREAIFAIEHVAHRSHARGTHGLAAITAVAYCVHIGMDGTLHGTLLSPKKPISIGHSAART